MNAEQRVRLAIGDLVIQLQAALARIQELEQEIKEREQIVNPESDARRKTNGPADVANLL